MVEIKLHFVKANPTGNITIFILNPVPQNEKVRISKELINRNNLYGEQVGFIESSNSEDCLCNNYVLLQMMGGEFCGNATRSLAAWMVDSQHPNIKELDDNHIVMIKSSGVKDPIKCIVSQTSKQNAYCSSINMPIPLLMEEFNFYTNGEFIKTMKIHFPGIIHFIVDDNIIKNRIDLLNVIRNEMRNIEYDAYGIMFYDYQEMFLEPLVYVKATDSLIWEQSCASGTAALGVALSYENRSNFTQNINQPGGALEISIEWIDNDVSKINLKGIVEIVAEGIVYI